MEFSHIYFLNSDYELPQLIYKAIKWGLILERGGRISHRSPHNEVIIGDYK